METIWKYELETIDSAQIVMPKERRLLTVQVQRGIPCLWALVDPDSPRETVTIITKGTCHLIYAPVGHYIGTYQLDDGSLIFHVFEA